MSKTETTDYEAVVIDNLMGLADNVMSERRITMLNYDDTEENQRLLDLHDRLVVMAREVSEFFASTSVPDTESESESDVESRIADEIIDQMPIGWSFTDLAKAAGVSKSTLDRILDGDTTRPQAKTLRKIEQALGMEEGHLDVE